MTGSALLGYCGSRHHGSWLQSHDLRKSNIVLCAGPWLRINSRSRPACRSVGFRPGGYGTRGSVRVEWACAPARPSLPDPWPGPLGQRGAPSGWLALRRRQGPVLRFLRGHLEVCMPTELYHAPWVLSSAEANMNEHITVDIDRSCSVERG